MDDKTRILKEYPGTPADIIKIDKPLPHVAIVKFDISCEINGVTDDGYIGPKPIFRQKGQSHIKQINGKNFDECSARLKQFMDDLGKIITPFFGDSNV